jgi:uncharacterized protein YuzE
MKITYDPQVDTLSILLSSTPKTSTAEYRGLIFDYDRDGNVVKLKIIKASLRIDDPQTIEYSIYFPSAFALVTHEQRRNFLKLPLEERRRLLAQQSFHLIEHYQQNTNWKEFLAGDIIDY